MRTTSATASLVTSTPPLHPQPILDSAEEESTDEEEVEGEGEEEERQDDKAAVTSQPLGRLGPATTTVPSTLNPSTMVPTPETLAPPPTNTPLYPSMNTADVLSAYSNAAAAAAAGFDFSSRGVGGLGAGAATSPGAISAAAHAAAMAAAASVNGFGAPNGALAPSGFQTGQQQLQHSSTQQQPTTGFGNSTVVSSSSTNSTAISEVGDGQTLALVRELEDYVERGLEGALAVERGDPNAPTEEAIAELQLQAARRLRQLLPGNRDLLHLVQERNWIPLLLAWLNLHDRPAVQVEALLALTTIAELSAQQSYHQHAAAAAAASSAAAAAAASAAALAAGGNTNSIGGSNTVMGAPTASAPSPAGYYSFPAPGGTSVGGAPAPSTYSPFLPSGAPTSAAPSTTPFRFPAPSTPPGTMAFGDAGTGALQASSATGLYQFPQIHSGGIESGSPAFPSGPGASPGFVFPSSSSAPASGPVSSMVSTSGKDTTMGEECESETDEDESEVSVEGKDVNTGTSSMHSAPVETPAPAPIALQQPSLPTFNFGAPSPGGTGSYGVPGGDGQQQHQQLAPPFEWDAGTAAAMAQLAVTNSFSTGTPSSAPGGLGLSMGPNNGPGNSTSGSGAVPPSSFPLSLPPLPFPSPSDSSGAGTLAVAGSGSGGMDGVAPPPPPPTSGVMPPNGLTNTTTSGTAGGGSSTSLALASSSSLTLPQGPGAMTSSLPAPVAGALGTAGSMLGAMSGNAGTALAFGGSSSFSGSSSIPEPLPASSQHLLLRHADAIPTLISLLSNPNREVHEQALWILGSIASGEGSSNGATGSSGNTGTSSTGAALTVAEKGSTASDTTSLTAPEKTLASDTGSNSGSNADKKSSVAARDVVLAAGVMKPLLRCLESNPLNLSLQRIGSWALSNLVEGQFQQQSGSKGNSSSKTLEKSDSHSYSSADEIDIRTLLPTLRRLLHMADAEVLSYTCWTLSHLCDGPSSHISAVVTTRDPHALPGGLVPRLVDLLLHPSWRVTKPALRTIGNIVCAECGDDAAAAAAAAALADPSLPPPPADYTEVILECNAVPRLKHLITHANREIQKEACWTLSNIAAGTVDQIQAVIDSGAVPPLVRLVSDGTTDQEVRSEACWVVLNATSCGSDQQIEILVDEGCVSVLGVLLGEPSMVMMALEGLERVLQVEEGREVARRARLADLDEYGEDDLDEDDPPPSPLVSASLIEKALEKHNSTAVSKRAGRIWKQHFVSCALCRQSFSKHRPADARFCNECKCHVCSGCDCRVYHLSYQEELWAEDEDKNAAKTSAKKNAKKSRKAKKKAKQQEKKKKAQQEKEKAEQLAKKKQQRQKEQQHQKEASVTRSHSSTVTSLSDSGSGTGGDGGGKRGKRGKGRKKNGNRGLDEGAANGVPPLNELTVVSPSTSKSTKQNPPKQLLSPTRKDGDKAYKNGKGNKATNNKSSTSGAKDGKKKKNGENSPHGKGSVVSPFPEDDEVVADDTLDVENEEKGNVSDSEDQQPPIDFVLYLQQTGSIIALAKLMDALEYGDVSGDHQEEMDAELQRLKEQQGCERILGQQATTT